MLEELKIDGAIYESSVIFLRCVYMKSVENLLKYCKNSVFDTEKGLSHSDHLGHF